MTLCSEFRIPMMSNHFAFYFVFPFHYSFTNCHDHSREWANELLLKKRKEFLFYIVKWVRKKFEIDHFPFCLNHKTVDIAVIVNCYGWIEFLFHDWESRKRALKIAGLFRFYDFWVNYSLPKNRFVRFLKIKHFYFDTNNK